MEQGRGRTPVCKLPRRCSCSHPRPSTPQGYKGHKDLVSGLAFRQNTHQLFSASFDRSVKLWSLDDGAYMDSLFGHQSEVTSVDVGRQERCVTAGFDRSCRVWKIPEETQMVYRCTTLATDCVKCGHAPGSKGQGRGGRSTRPKHVA